WARRRCSCSTSARSTCLRPPARRRRHRRTARSRRPRAPPRRPPLRRRSPGPVAADVGGPGGGPSAATAWPSNGAKGAAPPCAAHVHRSTALTPLGGSALLDADRLLGALPDGLVALLAQVVGRVLLEHVEEVVVTDLEHFGDDAHADGIALAEVEVDHDL